jgi:hypothetical protein
MAEHGRTEYATATGNDYAEHEATYLNVMKLAKVGTVAVIAVVVALGIHGTTDSIFWSIFGVIAALVTLFYGLFKDTVVPAASVLVFLLIVWAFLV